MFIVSCDVLGFAIAYQWPEDGFAYLTRGGAKLIIEEIHSGSERTWLAAALEQPFGRGINLQISVQRVEALYTAVKAAAIPIFWPLEDKWYRAVEGYVGSRQFVVQDPDGYLLRSAQDLGSRFMNSQ